MPKEEETIWFKSLNEEDKNCVRRLVLLSKEEYISQYFIDMSVYGSLNENNISINDLYYDNEKYHNGILIMNKGGDVIDVRTNAENNSSLMIKEILKLLNISKNEITNLDNKNLNQFFDESKTLISQAYETGDIKNEEQDDLIINENLIYKNLVEEFGLNNLKGEDQKEMLIELAKTIQKQFLLDVYTQIDEEKFKALEASIDMGPEFYDTTLKHLVPTYDDIFKNSRTKVLNNFKK